jgi:4-diphosphocytidyl-2-C-methyl-D-erythritol kinase
LCSAPAKINLALEVQGILPDGYHELDTIFCWLELEDLLDVRPSAKTELIIQDEIGQGAEVVDDEENLVMKALRGLEDLVGRELPTRLRLIKRIPAGGGLGGGSADAAATLLGVVRAHGLPLQPADLLKLAARLGADVAFGLEGGTARGRGRGELLSPLPPPPDLPVLLLIPHFPLSTPEVYDCWDRLPEEVRRPGRGSAERVMAALSKGRARDLLRSTGNDLADLRRRMLQAGCAQARLCGSGSTLFGLLEPGCDPEPVATRLKNLGHVLCTRFRGSPR